MANKNRHIIIVPFENHKLQDWLADPYFASITKKYGNTTNFHGFSAISLPDYIMETSGSNQGRTSDTFTFCEFKVNNIYDVLISNGMTYENFEEKTGSQGNHRHTPGYFYPTTCKSVQDLNVFYQKYRDGNQIPTNYTWTTPNFCNDAHDCGVSVASNWLKNVFKLDTILQKPWFQDGTTLIILVCDDGGNAANPTICIMISTSSMNKVSNVHYDHMNTLSTAMWWLGLTGSIGNSNSSKAMTDLFGATPPPVQLTVSENINPATANIGQQVTFTATATGGTPPYTYNWTNLPSPIKSSNSPTIVGTPDTKGTYIVGITVTDSAPVPATVTVSNTLVVNSQPIPILTSIILSPTSVSVSINNTTQLTTTCKDQNNNAMICPTLTWTSSDLSKATVDFTGKVTGMAIGTASITAKYEQQSPLPISIASNPSVVTVVALTSGITVTNPSLGLVYKVGEPRVVRWTHASGTGANVKIELLKASALIKTVSPSTPNDDVFSWTIPSVSTGDDYQIRVTSTTNTQYTGTSDNFTIQGTIPLPVLASITVYPTTISINVNESTQLNVTCKDQSNNVMTCPVLTWTSSDPSKATVDPTGKVTGVTVGAVDITAKSGSITSNISTVTIVQQVENKFSIYDVVPDNATNNVGIVTILDNAGTFTKDQACAEICRKLSLL